MRGRDVSQLKRRVQKKRAVRDALRRFAMKCYARWLLWRGKSIAHLCKSPRRVW